jgi:hypothetical protein
VNCAGNLASYVIQIRNKLGRIMVKEDEDVVADIEVAGRLLTDTINKDSRFAFRDLQDALESARHSSHRYTIPPKEVN